MRVSREGLGYRAAVIEEGISLSVDRITESRGETYGELTVERIPEGHLMRSRMSLVSSGARQGAARYLESRSSGVRWTSILETLFVEVLRQEREGAPVVTIGKLPKRPSTEFLLRPMLPDGKPTILFGAEGTGKSTLAAAIAVTVATGQPCLGGWSVDQTRQVLILDWESSPADWNDLIAAVACGVDQEPPDVLYREMAQALTSDLYSVARIVAENDVGLVIIDSVGLASPSAKEGSDANDAAVRLFSALRHLRTTTLLIDHVTKSDDSGTTSRPYGSVYKPALARATYELRAAEEADADGTRHLALYHRKHNMTARQAPVGIAVRRDAAICELRVEPVLLSDDRIAKGATLTDRIRDTLREGALSVEEIATLTSSEGGVVRRTLNRHRDLFVPVGQPGKKANVWAIKSNRDSVPGHVPHGTRDSGTPPTGGVSHGVPQRPGPSDEVGKFDGLRDLKPGAAA